LSCINEKNYSWVRQKFIWWKILGRYCTALYLKPWFLFLLSVCRKWNVLSRCKWIHSLSHEYRWNAGRDSYTSSPLFIICRDRLSLWVRIFKKHTQWSLCIIIELSVEMKCLWIKWHYIHLFQQGAVSVLFRCSQWNYRETGIQWNNSRNCR
jgi:hypothetical protein